MQVHAGVCKYIHSDRIVCDEVQLQVLICPPELHDRICCFPKAYLVNADTRADAKQKENVNSEATKRHVCITLQSLSNACPKERT